jgi:tRNA pseudouridine38-40 synthase
MNRRLQGRIRLEDGWETETDFHPRFQAIQREYTYLLDVTGRAPDPFLGSLVTFPGKSLDWSLVEGHLTCLLGTHNFRSFCARPSKEGRPVRKLTALELHPGSEILRIRIEGLSFLRGMVRHLVGAAIRIASGERPPSYLQELLDLGARGEKDESLHPAPASGLYLSRVRYPSGLLGERFYPMESPSFGPWWGSNRD